MTNSGKTTEKLKAKTPMTAIITSGTHSSGTLRDVAEAGPDLALGPGATAGRAQLAQLRIMARAASTAM